jgi:hypothetical protein
MARKLDNTTPGQLAAPASNQKCIMDQPTNKLPTERPHPSDRPVLPDDPMSLNAIEFDGDPEFMLKIMVEEYARLGCDFETFVGMCQEPFYQGLYGLWVHFGQDELRRRAKEAFARCGVVRVKVTHTKPANDQLVQIALTGQHDSSEGTSDV